MTHKPSLLLLSLCAAMAAQAEVIEVSQMRYFGPIQTPTPVVLGDTTKLKVDAFDYVPSKMPASAEYITIGEVAPGDGVAETVNLLEFDFDNRSYTAVSLDIKGLSNYKAKVDGKPYNGGKLDLHPGTHKAMISYLSRPNESDSLKVSINADRDGVIELITDSKRLFTLNDIIYGTKLNMAQVSPTGNYLLAGYYDAAPEGKNSYWQVLYDAKTGKPLRRMGENVRWMPKSDRFYSVRNNYNDGRTLVVTDAATGTEQVLAENLPKGNFFIAPSEDYLVYTLERKGKAEDPQAYQVLEPDDRQPGWRDRSYAAIYYLDGSGVMMPISTGSQTSYVQDISRDGKKILLSASKTRLQKRPTTVSSLLLVDVPTLKADTLVLDDGFFVSASFSPDGKKAVITGTPEFADRIGCILPDDITPSMVQQELFIIDLASKEITPITKDFNPNPQSTIWSEYDGNIYTRAEKRDQYAIFRYDVKNGRWSEVELPEELPMSFSLAETAPIMGWYGQSGCNSDGLYLTNLRTGKSQLLDRPSQDRLQDVRLAQMKEYNFVNEKGDTIYGRYYLPDNFDPNKKYPLIVNYYGGCSPTQRLFESRYPFHTYAPLGYVVYVIQPSGATGFGQEFSSRHVNTAGNGPAQDIIEGTQKFLADHPFVNPEKVGCIGASYGGFMTQYLQTITDIFAAAISHAGISDHTSYWGEGYWGYSYSETSMANSYPWTREDLYIQQSPLFNVEKVNTPILFLHGDSDTNVPVGESIQMFTALKLLDKDTAMVLIKGEDHHIKDPEKRQKWQDTIFAWFAKYLQDDPTWWDAMYPDKGL